MHIVYKKRGETPLQCLRRIFKGPGTRTYAGRLDPMAEGLLLVLEGEECKRANEYRALEKTYEYGFAVGIATDTYDCLGRVTEFRPPEKTARDETGKAIQDLQGAVTLPYPPYSSKTVNGIPLFEYARNNRIESIEIPDSATTVHENNLIAVGTTTVKEIREETAKAARNLEGDFRKDEIRADWEALPNRTIPVFSATLRASAGTYVRAIVNGIGKKIGLPTVTTRVKRTGIGAWTESDISRDPRR